jgi:hypothetical protein
VAICTQTTRHTVAANLLAMGWQTCTPCLLLPTSLAGVVMRHGIKFLYSNVRIFYSRGTI